MKDFDRHPAFFPSLFFLLGIGMVFRPSIALLIPLTLLCFCRSHKKGLISGLLFFLLGLLQGSFSKETFVSDKEHGTALFIAHTIQESQMHNKKSYKIKGTISSMFDKEKKVASQIDCTIPICPSLLSNLSNRYLITGTLEKKTHSFSFVPDSDQAFIPLDSSFSLVKWRFQTKKNLSKTIHSLYPNKKVCDFLIALTLGDLQDKHLRFSFSKLGLQHILAISGFHFGLLTLFLGFFLSIFIKNRVSLIILGILLSFYFLLLGNSASVLRAYLATLFILIAKLCKKRYTPLNIFSLTLLLELLLVPKNITNLGFQLSFLATGSILILSPITLSWMERLLPKRTALQLTNLSFIEKIIYRICCFLKNTCAINLAVHLTILPSCLFHFEQFPLTCLLYNLFIPAATSLILFIFLFSLIFLPFYQPLTQMLSYYNELFTHHVLKVILESPNSLNCNLFYENMSKILLFSLLCLVFFLARIKGRLQEDSYSTHPFP